MRILPLNIGLFLSMVLAVSRPSQLVTAQETRAAADQPAPIGRWHVVAEMSERREYAGGVLLSDGKVLAVSGHPLDGKPIASAELFDPATRAWSNTGSLREPRNGGNEATRLLDGRVLVAGGISGINAIHGAELFDPKTGRWSDAGKLSVARDAKATLMADGRILVSGGIDWQVEDGKAYDLVEIFDPMSGRWTATGSLVAPRYAHQTIRLDDGRVLAVGGYKKGDVLLAETELYDPRTALWRAAGTLPSSRVAFGLAKLKDGRILMAGGFTGVEWKHRTNVATAAIFDPKSERWTETAPMSQMCAGHSFTVLPDGRVLAAGGWAQNGLEFKSAELFDPATESWRAVAPMNVARRNHRATLLSDGSVLVIGGSTRLGGTYLNSCEVFRE